MRIHQGKKCMKKLMPCRSSDRETRSKSSQDKNHIGANHSGSIVAVADTNSVGQEVRDHGIVPQEASVVQDVGNQGMVQDMREQVVEPLEGGLRKPAIQWPTANEKAKYKILEEKVSETYRQKGRGPTKDRLNQLSLIIYDTGLKTAMKRLVKKAGGKSRHGRKMEQLRKEKKELIKRWKEATRVETSVRGL